MEAAMSVATAGPSSPRKVIHYATANGPIDLTGGVNHDEEEDDSIPRSMQPRKWSSATTKRVQDDVYVDIEPVHAQHPRPRAIENDAQDVTGSSSVDTAAQDVVEISDDDYMDDDSDDEDADEDDITLLPTTRSKSLSPRKISDADVYQDDYMDIMADMSQSQESVMHQRTPLQKLSAYIEDFLLCEERDLPDEDGLKQIASSSSNKLPNEVQTFFEMWRDTAMPRSDVFARVNMLARSSISAAAKNGSTSASLGNDASQSTGDEEGDIRKLDTESLARFIKVIYRSVTKRGGSVDPFPVTSTASSKQSKKRKANAQKPATKKARASKAGAHGSDTSLDNIDDENHSGNPESLDASDQLTGMAARLGDVLYSVRAAECVLSILSPLICDDALLCDEMIAPSLHILRNALDFFFVPFVRTSAGTSTKSNALLNTLVEQLDNPSTATSSTAQTSFSKTIAANVSTLQTILAKVQDLATLPLWQPSNYNVAVLADSLVPLVNCSETSTSASASVWTGSILSIRLTALRIVSLLNAKSLESEATINTVLDHIDSYNSSTSKKSKQAWLGSDRIQPLTALIVHLIQDSALPLEGVTRSEIAPAGSQDSESGDEGKEDDEILDEAPLDFDKMRRALDRPRDIAKLFAEGIIWRLKAKKATKKGSSAEIDLTGIFEGLTKDLLLILYSPEWPAASLLASHLTRLLCSALEDRATSPDIRGVAIDFLGALACGIRASQAKLRSEDDSTSCSGVERFAVIAEKHDIAALEDVSKSYNAVIRYLFELNRRDGLYTSAINFISAHRAVELACVHHKSSNQLAAGTDSQEQETQSSAVISPFQSAIESIARQDVTASHKLTAIAKSERSSTRLLFEQLVHTFNFSVPLDLICDKLLEASEGPVASNRAKALRALSNISQADDTFLHEPDVRQAVQRCLLDESVHVRDGAVALLGKFVLANPRYMSSLFLSLRSKIDDSGLLVRKRALRLMADIYKASTSLETRIQASVSIVRSITDEEPSMQDMAVEAIVDNWFGTLPAAVEVCGPTKVASINAGEYSPTRLSPDNAPDHKIEALPVMVAVTDLLPAKNSPLELLLRRIAEDKSKEAFAQRLVVIVDDLAAHIVSLSEQGLEDANRHARTMSLLVRVMPTTLGIRTARELLPCIRQNSSPLVSSLNGQLLETFSSALPVMHKTAVAFARQLQATLRPLVSQPSPHFAILQEVVRCYCLAVRHHTHDYDILVRTLTQCMTLTRNVLRKARTCKPVDTIERDDAVVVRLTALLVEFGDFEHIKEHSHASKAALKEVAARGVAETLTELLSQLHSRHGYAIHALHALRFVFRGHPHIMVQDGAAATVLTILSSGNMQERAIILRAIADIMASDEAKSLGKPVKAKETKLVSASTNVPASFEVLRSYLKPAIALVAEPTLQPLVLEILQHAVLRGLCHPMECLAALVALQTLQENQVIRHDAQRLYKHLISKAQSINFRYAMCARQAWDFQVALKGPLVRGTSSSGQALFQSWYSVVRDNQPKAARTELLRAYLKAFDIDVTSTACTGQDVCYARFMAENLATLDLRTPEEVNLVTEALQGLILGAGSQIRRSAQEELEVEGEDVDEDDDGNRDEGEVQYLLALGRMATIVALAVLLHTHLTTSRGTASAGMPGTTTRLEDLSSLPGTSGKRVEGLRLARAELGHLDALLGSLEDDDDDE